MCYVPLALTRFYAKMARNVSSPALLGALIRAVSLASQLLVLVLMGRLLPKNDFGDAILVFTSYRLLSFAIGSGAGSLLVYHVARHGGDAALDLYLSRRLTVVTGILAGGVSFACALSAPFISHLFGKPGMAAWLVHMSPLVLFGALLQVSASSLDGRNRVTDSILLTELTPNLLRTFGMTCVAMCGLPQIAVGWVFWLAVAAPWIIDALRLLARRVPSTIKQFGRLDARYAFWMGIYPLLGMQLQGVDMLIAGALFSSGTVAEYSIASRLATLFPFLQQIIVRVFVPRSGPLFKKSDTETINHELEELRRTSLASTAGMAAVILLFAPVVLHLMGDYSAGLGVLAALALPPLVRSNFAGIEVVLKMRAQGRALAVIAATSLLVIVLGSWLLHGIIGVYALPASMLVSAISINSLMALRIHRSGIDITSRKLAPLIVGACVALVFAVWWLPPVAAALASGVLMSNVAWIAYRSQGGKLDAAVKCNLP